MIDQTIILFITSIIYIIILYIPDNVDTTFTIRREEYWRSANNFVFGLVSISARIYRLVIRNVTNVKGDT